MLIPTLPRGNAYDSKGDAILSTRFVFCVSLFVMVGLVAPCPAPAQPLTDDELTEWNHQIRRDKFDIVLPRVMRERDVDMWIHVSREVIPDTFGKDELGSTSGVFVFTDRGGNHIERAVLGRRWGASQRERVAWDTTGVEESNAYDIVADAVRKQQPTGGPMTEYDYRFAGLRAFVEARDPKRIAVNFKHKLGPYVTYNMSSDQGVWDGLTHTDYLLLTEELGPQLAERIVSAEFIMMDYITSKVPSEIKLLKRLMKDRVARVKEEFDAVVPGVTRTRDANGTVLRRMRPGQSQRGRSDGWEDSVVQGGDILASPSTGTYAYVLRDGETEPPPEIQRLWAEYLKVDKIMAEEIKSGITAREIIQNYTKRFEEEGVIMRADQLHMVIPKNDFGVFAAGSDPEKTHLSVDCHGMMKGARPRPNENYFSPRIGSQGPDWTKEIPLPTNHHFVLEYFFYMPAPTDNPQEDQYLLWWDHEAALATESGVEYLAPPQTELYLIK